MKVLYSIAALILSLTLCRAQSSDSPKPVPDEAYTRQLVQLLTGLQKNPWSGWKSGTKVVMRYRGNDDPAAKPFFYGQPDLMFEVLQQDKLVAVTQIVNRKPHRQEHSVKDQAGAAEMPIRAEDTTPASLVIDGFTLACLLWELQIHIFDAPGSGSVKEWRLASHPTLLLRKESNGTTWEVASVLVTKKIGEREFQCVKTTGKMSIYSDGPMEVITTQYLSPDVPGHSVERIEEFYKIINGQRETSPHMIVHQKVVELKLLP